ncbi:hypothetical protein V2J09_018926 [Rumex salicifolius]
MLLTLDEKNPRRIFEGDALLRRMFRHGLLDETQNKLDYVLSLTVENFLERRLQTLVFKAGMAKSIHHARVLIRQKHIRVGRQVVNIPSFMVRVDSQKHIDFSLTSPFGGGRPGRVKRRNQKAAAKKSSGGDGDEDEDPVSQFVRQMKCNEIIFKPLTHHLDWNIGLYHAIIPFLKILSTANILA